MTEVSKPVIIYIIDNNTTMPVTQVKLLEKQNKNLKRFESYALRSFFFLCSGGVQKMLSKQRNDQNSMVYNISS